ncbi:hypothetical protein SAMN05444159_1677 [Bradyrhizobium lablabi]|uniref:Uncharacterized protein n=1 Tax=Bradyrhizobium lablabi TaxID=722472 RepID=A0A1M6MN23_9BRAD|nr:hypothetical protein [Bradyrhizobium lablabi]SHJ84881.1 hypothetical protein SAMN05444159_1677 [Bradyrhizobium lablabi]
MASGDLIPSNHDQSEPADAEVQFALVITRMIDSVKNNPDDMRQAIYDLARYKLQEQFTYADVKDIKRTQQALESAIRGVEAFSRQHGSITAAVPPPSGIGHPDVKEPVSRDLPPEWIRDVGSQPRFGMKRAPADVSWRSTRRLPWPYVKRTLGMFAILVAILVAVQQRERFALLIQNLPKYERQAAVEQPRPPAPAISVKIPEPPPKKPAPLRPTDYGVYAVSDDSLIELQPLTGRPPDIRVAVSAALKAPNRTLLPNGHPKFIVFRRDVASNISDRAEVRIMAKIAREFSAEVAGKKPSDGDDSWVIRNLSFPFRSSPVSDNPEMYELHSEDPALELTPGRYALVLKNQAYDFIVEGEAVDPRQCIERIITSNGTYYSECKKL